MNCECLIIYKAKIPTLMTQCLIIEKKSFPVICFIILSGVPWDFIFCTYQNFRDTKGRETIHTFNLYDKLFNSLD